MRYNAKRCKWKGIEFKSHFERDVFKMMHTDIHKMAKELRTTLRIAYESDWLKYEPTVMYYNPDYTFIKSDGSKMFIEAKGYFNARDRKKMKLVKKSNPELDIRMVFQSNHKVGTKWRCSTWCERNDFPYAFETVPKDWLRE